MTTGLLIVSVVMTAYVIYLDNKLAYAKAEIRTLRAMVTFRGKNIERLRNMIHERENK